MKPIQLFNSLSGKKEPFRPLTEGNVGMYVCGPTVYGDPHLGHARSAVTFDVIFRFLKYCGYKVRYVRNITDVGHLEDEYNEAGEDKILKKAKLEQLEPMEVAQYYTNRYRQSMRLLGIQEPSIEPVASGHIPEQIALIEKILAAGLAYVVAGSVYFDVSSYAQKYPYGELSGRVLEGLKEGQRALTGTTDKRFHADFALWKKAGPEHLMQWDSPWGRGFPGWHIECTAMSSKYLGVPFDIHGGGMDLKFPHHEAEICQGRAAFGRPPVKYWVHNNMVTLEGQKMAKSRGNFITLQEMFLGNHPLLEKAYNPMVVRFYMLQAHYGSPIDFSNKALQAAEIALDRLMESGRIVAAFEVAANTDTDTVLAGRIREYCEACLTYMCDDFNTARTIAALFELSSIIRLLDSDAGKRAALSRQTISLLKATFCGFMEDILGLRATPEEQGKLDQVMQVILTIRNQAKKEKNYSFSDDLRNQLEKAGIRIMDNKNGSSSYLI